MNNSTKINIVGLGKAGLPLAAHIVNKGFQVTGVDIDQKRCDIINKGGNPIPEESGLSELISKFGGKELCATSDWEKTREGDVFIVIVPLFIDKNNNPDFSIVDSVTKNIGHFLKKGDSVIFETTFPPTTTETRLKRILETESGLIESVDFYLGYSPERIMTGVSLSRFELFPKVISGVSQASTEKVYEIYSQFIPNLNKVIDTKTAEFIKVIEGCYRDTNIALANELFKIAEELGIDFYEAREFANHQYCNIHTPSTGVGGHCIPVYPHFLINKMNEIGKESHRELLMTVRDLNEDMINYWSEKIILRALAISKPLHDVNILIKGITYRNRVKEMYHSRNLALVKVLIEKGLHISVFDPMYTKEEIQMLGFNYASQGDVEFDCFSLSFNK